MRFAAAILVVSFALWRAPELSAQALQVDLEEFKRLAGEVADLRDAHLAQQKRILALQSEVARLREALREVQERSTVKMADFVTREDLKKTVDRTISEVDERREADKKLILGEFENLSRLLAQSSKPRRSDPEPRNPEPAKPFVGTVIPYEIKSGDGSLSQILERYNLDLKQQGLPSISLRDIERANPNLNPNRIFVGQKIDLPVPDKK